LSLYSFLAALPALLGLAGFVLYQLVGSSRSGDEVTRRIIDKVRQNAPSKIPGHQKLSGSQLERLLVGDQQLQRLVGEQDFILLRQALRQQFVVTLTVYFLSISFCALSVFLFVRQAQARQQLSVDHWAIVSISQDSAGLPVDLDTLQISWRSSGEPQDVEIYLENVQTSLRTPPQRIPSSTNMIRFDPETYRSILSIRERNRSNRFRAVMQARNASFASGAVDLRVGLTVLTLVDADAQLTVAAMIDNTRIPFYDFQARIVVPPSLPTEDYLSLGPDIPYRFAPRRIPHPARYDWARAKGIYLGPDDARLVRFQFLMDSSLGRSRRKN